MSSQQPELPAMYTSLAPYYPLLDALEDHEAECCEWLVAFNEVLGHGPRALLELGAGAGRNGYYLSHACHSTLTDPSSAMLDLSRALNPGAEHIAGDMRSLRLGRRFDAVLIHDAIVYMTSEADLLAALTTAFVHTAPGGAAIFAPDFLREGFKESCDDHEGAGGDLAFHCLEWTWDPDPLDDTYRVDYAWLLRDGSRMTHAHESHVEGLFSREVWLGLLSAAGFEARIIHRSLTPEDLEFGYTSEIFLGRRPDAPR